MTVLELNAKTCMAHLLLKPTFHTFSFIEGDVVTFNHFHIDGELYKDFFDEAPDQEYSLWKDVQEYFLQMIRGKRTPLSFKIILSLNPEEFPRFLSEHDLAFSPENIQGLYLNLRYDGKELQCVTGTSTKTFTMDKTLEQEWDKYAHSFFARIQ